METVQQADPKARRKTIWVICVVTCLGIAAILAFEHLQHDLQAWLERNFDFLLEHPLIVFVVSLLGVSPVLAVGTYLLLFGNRAVRTQRFPPRGYAVVRDIQILKGSKGIRRGRVIQLLSLFLLCSAAAIPIILWYLFLSFSVAR